MNEQKEIEVKIQIENPDIVRVLLESMNVEMIDHCIEEDHYFNHPCLDFALTDQALRLRKRTCNKKGVFFTITYKGPRENRLDTVKTREEVELFLGEQAWSNMFKILNKLGFKHVIGFTKEREIYRGEGFTLSIDYLHGVGWFLEIELEKHRPESSLSELTSRIIQITMGRIIEKTYLEICLETRNCSEIKGRGNVNY
ncbi:MAG: class IV adenylate cyclase [Desulfurococcaceae archaeon]